MDRLKEIINSVIDTRKKIEVSSGDRGYFVEAEVRFGSITPYVFGEIVTDSIEYSVVEELYEIKNSKNVVLRKIVNDDNDQECDPMKFILKEEVSSDHIVLGSDVKLKIVLSIERSYSDVESKLFIMTRRKIRTSKELLGFRIDKTRIADGNDDMKYELELEITDNDVDVDYFLEYVNNIVSIIERNIDVKQMITSIVPKLDLSSYRFQKPVDVNVRDIMYKFKKGGSIGCKLDGVRKFIVIIEHNIYTISVSGVEVLIYNSMKKIDKFSVYDSEQLGDQYHIFDVIIRSGKDVSGEKLIKRLSYIPELCVYVNMELKKQLFIVKSHFIFRDFNGFREIHEMVLDKINDNVCDGIIYTSMDGYFNTVFRWKPVRTFDFAFVEGSLKLYSKGRLVDSDFVLQMSLESIENFSIIECYVEKSESKDDKGKAFYIRSRPDKKFPNLYEIVKKSLRFVGEENKILNSFRGKSLFFIRSYHNDVKRKLLEKGSGNLLDIGSGRGGDVSKWKAYVKVFCVEPDKEKLVELSNRVKNRISEFPRVEILSSKIEDIFEYRFNVKITTISAMFSLNLVNLEKTIGVIDKVSSDQCLFVCVVMSEKYVRRFFKSIDSDIFSCDSYVIGLRNNMLNINIKNTIVKDQTENLVDVDKFIKNMAKICFNLEDRRRMIDEFFMSDDEYVLSSMYEYLVFHKK